MYRHIRATFRRCTGSYFDVASLGTGRRRESHGHGRRELARSGRVVGLRERGGSSTAAGLVSVSSTNLGGFGHYDWPSA